MKILIFCINVCYIVKSFALLNLNTKALLFCTENLGKIIGDLTDASLSQSQRLVKCILEQTNIDKINKKGLGYVLENNVESLLSPKEQEKRKGYKPHPRTERRQKRSIIERTYQPPFYEDFDDHFLVRHKRSVESIPKTTRINYQKELTPPLDQKLCASCYAFVSTALIEHYLYKTTGNISELSVQHFVDCSGPPNYWNNGCNWGHFGDCADYLKEKPGVYHESDYPYIATEQNCHHKSNQILKSTIVEYVELSDEFAAYEALKAGYLVAGAVCVTNHFRFYKNGILNGDAACGCKKPDHAIVIVGIAFEPSYNMFYWIIRNSWGTSYGASGHVRMKAFSNCAAINSDLGHFKITSK
uniref:CSON004954 protein n=1 Tax=Culicoides sonorensis TaxID=179676 RepID=A0A336MQ80_CULSO